MLQKHAGDSIAHDMKEIKELEDLEEKECITHKEQGEAQR